MDTFLLAVRVLLSLGAVVAVLWIVQRRVTRAQRGSRPGDPLTVVSRRGVGQKASIVVVDSGGKRFLLGVTEQSVNVLHTEDAPAPARVLEAVPEPSAVAFAKALAGRTTVRERAGEGGDAAAEGTRAALRHRPAPRHGSPAAPLDGSILSPATWKQAGEALRKGLRG
ncbi:flagellar biosynthetic protein FliO [Paenarthrobacter sp. DKR-5]|uniref:FliO/MopB family protein n=1 Tax=Paenarthrobacter sp. DKR-5 TaxID=2835535 RepID=UPI001BDD7920|nr:flagellar biosynthetic protein FliO [Paenarthrobacter sp. DKR-5]MBT1002810.1 flagellar biosynthetic protein FliO [Paenarthrobacter sp. DKR-5]